MKWGRHRRQQQQEQQQEEEEHPSSAFSLFRVFPLSWISKRKPTKSKQEPPQPPTISHQSSTTTPVAQPRPHALPPSKLKPNPPDLRPRAPPARLSPDRALRPSFASDHLSFSPAFLDRLVRGAHEEEPDEAPRRYSCAGDDEDVPFFARNLAKGTRPFESARFRGASMEPGFPSLSCRSCRADPERSRGWGLSGDLDASSETVESEEENSVGRSRRRREASETAARRRPARDRRGTTWDDGPSPPKDATHIARAKAAHRFPTGEHNWSSSGRTEKRRHQTPAQEPAADEQRGGARRSFSLSGKARQRSKVKVHSPRVAAAAAAARAAAKQRKKVAEEEEEKKMRRGRSLESFAVVKCSVDPQRDFRESMEEMVRQNGMGRPEEMEGLLACYLTLNADEFHDVIVKVFRQVWLDVRPTRRVGSWSAAV